jgi:hypothetical protein
VGGILFAHRVEEHVRAGGKASGAGIGEFSVFTIQKVELDVDIPDALFALPAPHVSGPAPI